MDKKKIVGKKNRLMQYGVLIVALIITLSTIGYAVTRTITDNTDTYYSMIRNSNGNSWLDVSSNIQEAIDDLTDGGIVYLKGHRYVLTNDIVLKQNVSIIGEGVYNTVLVSNGCDSIIKLDLNVTRFSIKNIYIDGNGENVVGVNATDCGIIEPVQKTLDNVIIDDCEYGVRWGDEDGGSIVTDSYFRNSNVGFNVGESHPYIKHCKFSGNDVGFNGSYYHGRLIDCVFDRNGIGINGTDFERCSIENCRFTFNDYYDIIIGEYNTINDIHINKGTATIKAGVKIVDGRGVTISGLYYEFTGGVGADVRYNESLIYITGIPETVNNVIINRINVRADNKIYGDVIRFSDTPENEWVSYVQITDNVIHIQNGQFVNFSINRSVGHCDISHNIIRGDSGNGEPLIYIASSSNTNGNTIIGNTIVSSSGYTEGINVSAQATVIMGNKLRNVDIVLRNSDVNTVNENNVEI